MKKIASILLGLGIIGYLIYVFIRVVQTILGVSGHTWEGVIGHLIAIGILLVIILAGHFWGENQAEDTNEKETRPVSEKDSITYPTPSYNPLTDQLRFGVYRQEFSSWWYDNDGDKHEQGTIYASLRFYEDGTLIAIRDSSMPKREIPATFTMQGSYLLDKEKISLSLESISDVDDSIQINLSEDDKKQMKYYGEIADEESLIKAGSYQGKIQGNAISIGNFTFLKVGISKLIVTAEESTCDQLALIVTTHPHILDAFQDSGYWYTNGETGPEWFTIHIEAEQNWEKEVEEYVLFELKRMGKSANKLFWG